MKKFGRVLNKNMSYGIIKDKFHINGLILEILDVEIKDLIIAELEETECMAEILLKTICKSVFWQDFP